MTSDEIGVDEIIDAILEKQDSCTFREVYNTCVQYCKKHKGIYIDDSGDTIDAYVYDDINKYWVDEHHIIHKQVFFTCPFCEVKHRKYPNVEAYNKLIKKSREKN